MEGATSVCRAAIPPGIGSTAVSKQIGKDTAGSNFRSTLGGLGRKGPERSFPKDPVKIPPNHETVVERDAPARVCRVGYGLPRLFRVLFHRSDRTYTSCAPCGAAGVTRVAPASVARVYATKDLVHTAIRGQTTTPHAPATLDARIEQCNVCHKSRRGYKVHGRRFQRFGLHTWPFVCMYLKLPTKKRPASSHLPAVLPDSPNYHRSRFISVVAPVTIIGVHDLILALSLFCRSGRCLQASISGGGAATGPRTSTGSLAPASSHAICCRCRRFVRKGVERRNSQDEGVAHRQVGT